ncbi:MAG: hypothetical protein J6K55_12495 [Clostridia bacterium]|nr:hypothetical protein [Clostridia bacterium]
MTIEQREAVRKLQDKLCTKAARYKAVNEEECQGCESPCRYGMDLLDVLGLSKPQAHAENLFQKPVLGRDDGIRRMMNGIKRRWK